VQLQGNDILFVPDSTGRKVALRVMEAAISTGTGLAIYRRKDRSKKQQLEEQNAKFGSCQF